MTYYQSYDTAKARRYHKLLDELMKLCNTIPRKTSTTFGRPVAFPLPTLFILLVLKFDTGLPYRDFVAFLDFNRSLVQCLGLERPPSYSTLQKTLKRLDTRTVHKMYRLQAWEYPPPEDVAVDASGFSHTTGGEWKAIRFEMTLKRCFTALHIAVDTDTFLIQNVRIRGRPGGDAKEFIPLMGQVRTQRIKNVYGDRAYISRRNVQHIHDLGAYPVIEPKKNLKARSRGYRGYKELIREYRADPEEWKRQHNYGKRSQVETVFSMMKIRFGGGLNSRGRKEQWRELLIKVLIHNIDRLNYLECAGR